MQKIILFVVLSSSFRRKSWSIARMINFEAVYLPNWIRLSFRKEYYFLEIRRFRTYEIFASNTRMPKQWRFQQLFQFGCLAKSKRAGLSKDSTGIQNYVRVSSRIQVSQIRQLFITVRTGNILVNLFPMDSCIHNFIVSLNRLYISCGKTDIIHELFVEAVHPIKLLLTVLVSILRQSPYRSLVRSTLTFVTLCLV